MEFYLASPNTQQQAEHCVRQNVLLSYALWDKWLGDYQPSFNKILIDSGAYTVYNSGKSIDVEAYKDWSYNWVGYAEAIAGLDDISGNYKLSMHNYAAIPWSFPTWHDTDPLDLLPELVAIAKERKTWLGIGLQPPRYGKEKILREALELIPDNIHLHGWALRSYTHLRRFNSFDSTNWWRDAMKIRKLLPFLHYGECLELIIKRYEREARMLNFRQGTNETQEKLF